MSGSSNASWAPFPSSQTPTSHSDERWSMPTPSMPSPHPTLTSTLTSTHSYNTSPFTQHFPANDGPNHSHYPVPAGHDAYQRLYANPARLLEAISAEEERCKRNEEAEAIHAVSGVQHGQDRAHGRTRKGRAQRKTIKKDNGKGRAEAPGSPSQVLQSPRAYSYDIHNGSGERAYPTPSSLGAQSPSEQTLPTDHEVGSLPHQAYTSVHSYHNAQGSSFSYEQGAAQGTSSIHLLNVPDAVVPPAQTGQDLQHVPDPMRPRRNGRRPTGPYPTANVESGKRYYRGTKDNIATIKNRAAFHEKLLHHVQLAENARHEVVCWIDGCGVIIHGTRQDFETHLDANHPRTRTCTWLDSQNELCGNEYSQPALRRRHVLDFHCRVWNAVCPECGQTFPRNDTTTIKRHNCPERTCWGCREVLASKPAYAAHARKCKAVVFSGPSNVEEREQDEDPAVGPPMGIADVVGETLVDAQEPNSPSINDFAYAPVVRATPLQTRFSATSTPAPTSDPAPTYFGTSDFTGHLMTQPTDAYPDRPNSSDESSSSTQTLTPSLVPDGGVLGLAQQAGFDPAQDVFGSSTSSMPPFMPPYLPNDMTPAMHAQPLYDQDYFAAIHDGADDYLLEDILGISNYSEWDPSHSTW